MPRHPTYHETTEALRVRLAIERRHHRTALLLASLISRPDRRVDTMPPTPPAPGTRKPPRP